MAKQSAKSPLSGKLAKSLAAHAKDDTIVGRDFTNLPPGIIGGVALLADAHIGVYSKGPNQGESFIFLAGTVVEPREVSVVRRVFQDGKVVNLPVELVEVEGLFTRQTLPLCDTKNAAGEVTTQDEHVATALNVLRTLGGEDFTESIDDLGSLQDAVHALEEANVYFKFSTSSSPPTAMWPNERTWENWRGACEYVPEGGDESVVDETEVTPTDVPEEETEENKDVLPDRELLALGKRADAAVARKKHDEEAEETLGGAAVEAGVDPNELETWKEVAEAVIASRGAEGFDESEPEPKVASLPEIGEVWFYKPPHAKKPVECEVKKVYLSKKLADIKNLNDGRVFKSVPFDKLLSE